MLSSMARGEVEVEVKEENVMEVMQTAEYLQVAELSQYCQQVRLRRENLVLIFSQWLQVIHNHPLKV